MNIGTGAAENDGEFLSECFLETPEYKSVLDFEDKKMILLGRTGSGKTAIINMLEKDVDVFISVKPDTFALQYINNIPFIKGMKDEGINLEIFYKFLWLHEIISNIIKQYFAYNRKDFFKAFTEKLCSNTRIAQLKKYLDEYGNIFFEERSAQIITTEIEKKLAAELGFADFAKLRGTLSERQKQEIQTKASQCINSTQINQLKNVISLLKEYLENNKQRKIIVTIDDLDQNWVDDDAKYKLINALLDAIRLFVDVPNLKIIIAMRADLLAKTCKIMKRQNEKDVAFTLKLNWTRNMLIDLLNKRVNFLVYHKYKKNVKVNFKDLFDCEISGIKGYDYILERTMMRPRDAISFVNLCIAESDDADAITPAAIIMAEKAFRHDRLNSLSHEWANNYPNIMTYIQTVYVLGNKFSYNDAIANYKDVEGVLLSSNKNDDTIVEMFLSCEKDDNYCKTANIKKLLNVLFMIGIIGKEDIDGSIVYSTPNQPILNELDYIDDIKFVIHPLFAKHVSKIAA
jgi:GTP-binding protein EngB required for normal cell division